MKHNLAGMLTDLANLHRSAAAIERLRAKHPSFLPDAPPNLVMSVRYSKSEVKADIPDSLSYVVWLQEMVCALWKGNPGSRWLGDLEQVLLTGTLGINSKIPFLQSFNPPPLSGIIGVDWKHRSFAYKPQTLLQEALHFLMQQSPKAKICANPDCPAPYFIAPRSNARYCSEDCLQAVQRTAKRAWWNEKGQQWRASQRTNKNRRVKT